VTLIDFVADKRAPTPTAAAEMAVPVRAELIARVDGLARRSLACWSRAQDHRRTELRAAARALPSADALLAIPRQRLDACADRLPRALRANAQLHHTALSRIAARLSPQLLRGQVERRRARFAAAAGLLAASLRHNAEAQRTRIARARDRIGALMERGERALLTLIDRRADRLERAAQLLGALSYHGVLARGFALVRGPEGQPLRTAAAVAAGMRLDIEFQDGHVGATAETGATGRREPIAAQRPRPRRRSGGSSEGQGSLF
jgi:exodeoxyribonuclease VII large subunit